MIPRDADGRLLAPGPVLADAHEAGLRVTGWTFRRENRFLPLQHRRGEADEAAGDLAGEIATFLAAGMDDFFTDNPDVGVARARPVRRRRPLTFVRRSPGSATIRT